MASGSISFDGPPGSFLTWAQRTDEALETPAARLFSLCGIEPLPVGVRDARRSLATAPAATHLGRVVSGWGDLRRAEAAEGQASSRGAQSPGARSSAQRKKSTPPRRQDRPAFNAHALWVELTQREIARDVLRGIDLDVTSGEKVALMGRNGAGKSTLLKTAAGLIAPVRGRAETPRGIALLTQNPSDYLVRERVADELPGEAGQAALRIVGLEHAAEADPRDLSGGERQRLALAIALAGRMEGEELPGVIALDEPTRGMDRARKGDLVDLIGDLATRGAGLLVATHDVEFAAAFAERVVLMGDGVVIADGPAAEVLSGGWYFATEVARVLDLPGVITPEQGAEALRPAGEDG
jgi:energy-coupling factor transport system ATP-binding protein